MKLHLIPGRAAKTGIAWCALGRLAGAQVAGVGVDPHMVVLTSSRPAGEITVLNPHATRAEFSVDLRFGFATTDSAGQLHVELSDGPDSASAAGWIVPYPSRFSLRAGAMRTVRFMARPPADLADGEYWARISVHSRDGAVTSFVDSAASHNTRVNIAMEMVTVLPVFFRKGAVATSVVVSALTATAMRDSVEVRATLTRNGNAAFIGVAHIVVRDSSGRHIATADRQLAVYRSMQPRWRLALPPGVDTDGCTVAVALTTERHDVPRNMVLQARPVESIASVARSTGP